MFISADVYVMKDKYGVNVYSINLTLLLVYETSGNQVTTLSGQVNEGISIFRDNGLKIPQFMSVFLFKKKTVSNSNKANFV